MKNLCPKSKGKIHPSPLSPSASGSGDALSVLKLLPAAIFALTAALAFEDKEVVAYLMIRSINGLGQVEDAAEERRRCRRAAGAHHRPLFDCGCFDCYTCFWSRWDCSKARETIHMVVEAFEEHLASKERKGKEAKRRKKKGGKDEKREREAATANEREKDERMVETPLLAEENKGFVEGAVNVIEGCFAEEKEEEGAAAGIDDEVDEEGEAVELPAVSGGERRRGWADVMGFFNSRLWSLWSPGV